MRADCIGLIAVGRVQWAECSGDCCRVRISRCSSLLSPLLSSPLISSLPLSSSISPSLSLPFSLSHNFRDNLMLMMTDPGEGDAIKAALKEIIMIIVEMINPANPKWNNVHDDQVSYCFSLFRARVYYISHI